MAELKELIINAENHPLGRLAAVVGKKALLGEEIRIANCERVVISGTKKNILEDYKRRRSMGTTEHGPFFPKSPEGIVMRAVRGMLSYKKRKGREAFSRIKYEKGPVQGMKQLKIKNTQFFKSITIGELSKSL